MRFLLSFTLLAGTVLALADEEPAPLLKPVTPAGSSVRVRVATTEKPHGFYHFAAQVPKKAKKGEKGELVDVTVAFECRPGRSYVTVKKWQSWGYEVPANKVGILPELVIGGVQLAPKPTKGRDVEIKITGIRVEIVEPPGNADKIIGCDLLVAMNDFTKNSDRAFESRLYFADPFLEFTVSGKSVRPLGTGDDTPPEPFVNPDATLVPVAGPTVPRGSAMFAYAAVNGLTHYKTPDGKEMTVNATVGSTTNCPGGVVMTIGVVRGCEVELDEGKGLTGIGTDFETTLVKGKVKELRLGFQTGPGLKAQKDLVLKDVPVWVDKNDSGHVICLGPNFIREHFKDPVQACGPDGMWKLHGRVKPELLQDIKTRPKK
jgi:hypothetical protein